MTRFTAYSQVVALMAFQMLAIWNVFDARSAPARYLSATMVVLITAAVIWRVIQLRQRLRTVR
jgi:hypothetical protein